MTRVVVSRGGPPSTSQSRAAATSTSSPSVPPPPPLPPSLILPVLSSPTQRCSSSSLCKEEDSEVLTEALPSFSPDVELIDSRRASKLASRLGTLNIYSEADSSGREETRSLENSTAFVSGTEAERVKELPIAGYELDKHSHSQPDSSVSSSAPAASESSNPEGSRAGTGQHAVITRTLSGSSSAPLSTKAAGSSRRVTLAGSKPGVTFPRILKSRASPNSSPRAHGEDGYNSADESNPWTSEFEDDEERERHFEIELRRVKALEVKRMAADGNCLFRAVADQVYGDPEMFEETRQMCIDYMEKERDHFSQFVTEGFTAYCKRKRRDKVYGNNLEIQAMAEMYNRPIHIYSYSTDPINICHGHYETDLPPIRLSYHRGNHYNSLHDPSRPAVGAGLGFGSLRGRNVDRDQVKAAIRAQQDQQIDNALVAEGRYYSDLELTEQEIERMVMEASRAEYLAEERNRQLAQSSEETSSSAGGEPSTSGAASRGTGSAPGSQVGGSVGLPDATTIDAAMNRNSNVRMLLSMGFNYFRVMEACSIFGDDVNNMLCYLLETDSLGESMYRMKGKAAEK